MGNHQTGFIVHLPAAAGAFILWGGWAWFANQAAGAAQALQSALIQGCASATITLLMAMLVNWLFLRIRSPLLAVLLPPLLMVSLSISLLYLIHSAGQTPRLWLTIIPPSSLAFAFCLYLTLRLARQCSTSVNREHTP